MVADLPEAYRAPALDVIAEHNGFATQRGNVQPMDRTAALGKAMPDDFGTTPFPKGTTLEGHEIAALKNTRLRIVDKIDTLVSRYPSVLSLTSALPFLPPCLSSFFHSFVPSLLDLLP